MAQNIFTAENEKLVKSLSRRVAGKRKDLVDDLVQDSYLLLYKAAESYDSKRGVPFGGYAHVALKHELPKVAKSMTQVLSADEQVVVESLDEPEGYEAACYVLDCNLTPSERYELEDTRWAIRKAVNLLPRIERIAVSLYFGLDGFYERPYSSIAEESDCSVEGARKAVDRGINKLRVWFDGPDYICAFG